MSLDGRVRGDDELARGDWGRGRRGSIAGVHGRVRRGLVWFGMCGVGLGEHAADLVVGDLVEVEVPGADGVEVVWEEEADGFVTERFDAVPGLLGGDRDGDDEVGGVLLAECGQRGAHG